MPITTTIHSLNASFGYFMPSRLLFGVGQFENLGTEVARLGGRAMLVTGKQSARANGFTQRAVDLLKAKNVQVTLFEEAIPNPRADIVNRGAEIAQREGCEVIIGLGGGSPMDVAKGIAVAVPMGVDIWQVVDGQQAITRDALPIVLVPTTAGTGSEATPYAVISNPALRRKDAIMSAQVYPRVAILDPLLTVPLPPFQTASSGMDALTQAIEAYHSALASPISDLFAIEAIRLCAKSLRAAVHSPRNLEARADMLLASALAGVAIAQADTTLAHVVGEAVGAVYDTDHGASVTLTLPAVIEYNLPSRIDRYAHLAELLGENIGGLSARDAARKAPAAIRDLIHDLRLPAGLAAIGVNDAPETVLQSVMPLVLRPGLTASNPRAIDASGFETLIRASLQPQMSYWELAGEMA